MKAIYHEKANEGGVYRILNLVTGRFYYGSTYRFKKRYDSHKATLESSKHTNTFLLHEYRKYGSENFVFEVIEVVDGDEKRRLAVEQTYISKFYDGQKQCLNLRKDACDSRSGKKAHEPANPLTDKRCKSPSKELLAKRSAAIRKAKDNPESKERARENCKNGLWKNHSCNIAVQNLTTGEKVDIQGSLREWCLSNSLSYKAFHLMVQKKTKSSGGWTLL